MIHPKKLISSLGLTNAEADILLLIIGGTGSVSRMMKKTGHKRPTVYYALQRLIQRGIVQGKGKGEYVADLDAIIHSSNERVVATTKEQQELIAWVEATRAVSMGPGEHPRVTFYEGREAVRRVAMESLYTKSKKLCALSPSSNFFKDMGDEFLTTFLDERASRGIRVRSLWEKEISQTLFRRHYGELSNVRILSPKLQGRFHSILFLYDDKALYISSTKNMYALLVTSQEHNEFMQMLFDGLWESSTPHPTSSISLEPEC